MIASSGGGIGCVFGDRLIADLEGWAAGLGCRTLRLGVFAENGPAIGLYLRNGFRFREESGATLPGPVGTVEDGRVERTMTKTIARARSAAVG